MRHAIYTPVRVGTFEALRDAAAARGGGGGVLPLAATLAIGLTAGAVGQLAAVPADLAKIQAQTAAASGGRVGGLAAALAATARRGGARALWRGATPAVQRAALANVGELGTYNAAKGFVLQSRLAAEGPRANALAAIASGLVSALVSTPADVLKTRLMAQDPRAAGACRGMLDCAARCVREEGAAALWRGFWPTWARLGPWVSEDLTAPQNK
jgi:solute carrier family 25 uncoupling protein 27